MRFIWWVAIVNIFTINCFAFVAGEIRPGVIELRSEDSGGLTVQQMIKKKRAKKNWVYFCVVNKGPRRKQRCFYARDHQALTLKIQTGSELGRIEYALSPRIHNRRGRIAIGPKRYFYPVKDLGPLTP
jgi:hypothetical protein